MALIGSDPSPAMLAIGGLIGTIVFVLTLILTRELGLDDLRYGWLLARARRRSSWRGVR
jgi:hypothetical protein